MSALLTRKDVCARREIHPTTLWRWERLGLRFVRGRISEMELCWWLEQAEAAKRLGIPVLDFLALPRRRREPLLRLAFHGRTDIRPRRRRRVLLLG